MNSLLCKITHSFKDFLSQNSSFLLKNEPHNSMMYGTLGMIQKTPEAFKDTVFFSIQDEKTSKTSFAACYTTGTLNRIACSTTEDRKTSLACFYEGLITFLAQNTHLATIPAPIFPSIEDAEYFNTLWNENKISPPSSIECKMDQTFYTLRKSDLNIIKLGKNLKSRLATRKDLEICLTFWTDFMIETFHMDPMTFDLKKRFEASVINTIDCCRMYILEDTSKDIILTMTCKSGESPTGYRIGMVYTPPKYRKNGFASMLVSDLCNQIFEEGMTYCCLYTDDNNPTSNKIYSHIGFKAISKSKMFDYKY